MKRITILACLTLCLAASTVSASVLPVVNSPAKDLTIVEKFGEIINIGGIVITRVESNGSGYAKVLSTGHEIYYINPLNLPLRVGQTVTAEIYCESIIDPPKRIKKRVCGMMGWSDDTVAPEENVGPPYLAIIIAL